MGANLHWRGSVTLQVRLHTQVPTALPGIQYVEAASPPMVQHLMRHQACNYKSVAVMRLFIVVESNGFGCWLKIMLMILDRHP